MPNPNLSQLHVSQVLSNFSLAYMQDEDGFVGQLVAPFVPSDHITALFDIEGREGLMLLETEVAPTSVPGHIEWTQSQGTYTCGFHRLSATAEYHKEKNKSGSLINTSLEQKNTKKLTDYMKRGFEYRVMDACVGSATTFSGATLSGNHQWNSGHADATPVDDVQTAKDAILLGCQKDANLMVIGYEVFTKLMLNAQIQAYVAFDRGGSPAGAIAKTITTQILQDLFGIETVVIAKAQYINASLDAVNSTAASYIWGKHCWIGYVNPSVQTQMMSALKTFVFPWLSEGLTPVVRSIDETKYLWTWQDILWSYVVKVTATGAGYYVKNAVS